MNLVTASEMQAMDRKTIEEFGIPGVVLMENAGRGAVRFFMDTLLTEKSRRIGVMAGRGNNGGDGYVMARYLTQHGCAVTVFLLSSKSRVKGDAAANLNLLAPLGVPVIELPDPQTFESHKEQLIQQDIWIDAILGTGLNSDVRGYFKTVIEFINHRNKPVFAVDIPSGLNSDTGSPCGVAVQATATATFAFAKTGHLLYPGAAYSGQLGVVDIGIPPHITEAVAPKQGLVSLLRPEPLRDSLPPRLPDAHKGRSGHLLVVAGSPGKTGAAAMTAMSAMRVGAGLVTIALPESINGTLENQVIEAMTAPLPDTSDGQLDESALEPLLKLLEGKQGLAIGPGLGMAPETGRLVRAFIRECRAPIVIDADGLNHLVGHTALLRELTPPVVLTPHPGEMARLVDSTPAEVQKDRIAIARDFACANQVYIILKGARTVIAQPDGGVAINPTGNAGMASGGMGDVLTGCIAGLAVQGCTLGDAAQTGVFIHGAAADYLAANIGSQGFLATEVMNALPRQINRLRQGQIQMTDILPLSHIFG